MGKVIAIIALVIVLLPILTVGTVALLGYDGTKYTYEGDTNLNVQELLNDKVVESLDQSATTGKMNIEITQDDLNCMLNYVLTNNASLQEYVKGAKVEISDDNYVFHLAASVSGYKTTLGVYTKLDYSDKDSDNGDEIFTFQITKVKVGHLPNMTGIAKSIIPKYISDSTVDSAFENAGLHIKADLKNLKLTYAEEDILNDVYKMVGTSSTEGEEENTSMQDLIFSFLSDFFKNDYIQPDFNQSLKAIVNLDEFSKGDYLTKEKELNLNLDKLITNINVLYNNKIIEKDAFENVYQYLIYGYEHSKDETQNYIKDKDLTSIGITDNESYKGLDLNQNVSLMKTMEGFIPELGTLSVGSQITFMDETAINQYIKTKGFIGYSSLFTSTDGENVNYITVDNFYCNMFVENDKQYLSFVGGLSFNGYETYVTFNMIHDPENDPDSMAMKFKMDKFYFGNYTTSGAIADYLFSIMADSLAEDQTILVDNTDKSITIDFEPVLKSKTGLVEVINALGEVKMNVDNMTLDENGRIYATIAAAE